MNSTLSLSMSSTQIWIVVNHGSDSQSQGVGVLLLTGHDSEKLRQRLKEEQQEMRDIHSSTGRASIWNGREGAKRFFRESTNQNPRKAYEKPATIVGCRCKRALKREQTNRRIHTHTRQLQ